MLGQIQKHNRCRIDNGPVNYPPSWLASEDQNVSWITDIPFRIRFLVQNEGYDLSPYYILQYNKNSAGWNDVNAASLVVSSSNASLDASNTLITTSQLSNSGTFDLSFYSETGQSNTFSLTQPLSNYVSVRLDNANFAEYEFGININNADVTNGDTIELRLSSPHLPTYDVTPTITVIKPVNRKNIDISPGTTPVFLKGANLYFPTINVSKSETLTKTPNKNIDISPGTTPVFLKGANLYFPTINVSKSETLTKTPNKNINISPGTTPVFLKGANLYFPTINVSKSETLTKTPNKNINISQVILINIFKNILLEIQTSVSSTILNVFASLTKNVEILITIISDTTHLKTIHKIITNSLTSSLTNLKSVNLKMPILQALQFSIYKDIVLNINIFTTIIFNLLKTTSKYFTINILNTTTNIKNILKNININSTVTAFVLKLYFVVFNIISSISPSIVKLIYKTPRSAYLQTNTNVKKASTKFVNIINNLYITSLRKNITHTLLVPANTTLSVIKSIKTILYSTVTSTTSLSRDIFKNLKRRVWTTDPTLIKNVSKKLPTINKSTTLFMKKTSYLMNFIQTNTNLSLLKNTHLIPKLSSTTNTIFKKDITKRISVSLKGHFSNIKNISKRWTSQVTTNVKNIKSTLLMLSAETYSNVSNRINVLKNITIETSTSMEILQTFIYWVGLNINIQTSINTYKDVFKDFIINLRPNIDIFKLKYINDALEKLYVKYTIKINSVLENFKVNHMKILSKQRHSRFSMKN